LEFVPNEWFVEYMPPDHQMQRTVWEIMDRLEERGDKFVIRRRSPFISKFYRFNKLYGGQLSPAHALFRRLFLMTLDPARTRLIEEHEIFQLPSEIVAIIPPDDLYLLETANLTPERLIVTTDGRLREAVHGHHGFQLVMLETFVRDYLR